MSSMIFYSFLVALFFLPVPAWAQGVCFNSPCVGEWQGNGTPYSNGQMVKFNGTVWICNQPNCTTNLNPQQNQAQWNSLGGLRAWDGTTLYQPGQMVMRNGTLFTATVQNSGSDPSGGSNPVWRPRGSTPPPAVLAVAATPGSPTGNDIQTAIDTAPAGGIVQLLCATYNLGSGTVIINKGLHLQGCGGPSNDVTRPGSVITGNGSIHLQIDTTAAVQVSDLTFESGPTGTIVSVGPTASAGVTIRNVQIFGGGNGVIVTNGSEFTFRDSVINGVTGNGIVISDTTDTDRGTAWIHNNFIIGQGGTTAIVLQDTSSTFISGNKILGWETCIEINATVSAAHSEYHITGNAITCGQNGGSRGSLHLAAGSIGMGAIEITGNYIDALHSGGAGGTQPTVVLDGGSSNISNLTFTGNAMRTGTLAGSGAVLGSRLLGAVFSGNTIDFWSPNASGYAFNITSSSGVLVSNTAYIRSGFVTNPYQGSGYTITDLGVGSPIPLSTLNAINASAGSQVFCSDCNLTGSMQVCTGGGTGAMATRLAGAWRCQ